MFRDVGSDWVYVGAGFACQVNKPPNVVSTVASGVTLPSTNRLVPTRPAGEDRAAGQPPSGGTASSSSTAFSNGRPVGPTAGAAPGLAGPRRESSNGSLRTAKSEQGHSATGSGDRGVGALVGRDSSGGGSPTVSGSAKAPSPRAKKAPVPATSRDEATEDEEDDEEEQDGDDDDEEDDDGDDDGNEDHGDGSGDEELPVAATATHSGSTSLSPRTSASASVRSPKVATPTVPPAAPAVVAPSPVVDEADLSDSDGSEHSEHEGATQPSNDAVPLFNLDIKLKVPCLCASVSLPWAGCAYLVAACWWDVYRPVSKS